MKQFKFFASACYGGHGNWMAPIGGIETSDIEEADVVIFGGGADISPETYGEVKSRGTSSDPSREKKEKADFHRARELNKKLVGICRGHQFLVAMAGGKLIQDVSNHGSYHKMTTFDGSIIETNSIHHQMVNPYNMNPKDYTILAWSTKKRSDYYLGGGNKKMFLPINFKEIEAIYLPKINAIGYQYHPEMLYSRGQINPAVDWTQKTFMKFFENKI